MRLVLAGLVALAAPLAPAAAQAPAPVVRDGAGELAATVLPRQLIVSSRMASFDMAYAAEIAADRKLAALEQRHPGITRASAAAAHDAAAEAFGRVVDLLQADAAQLYRDRFTASEIVRLIAFFRTSFGQAMIAVSADSSGDTAAESEANRRAALIATIGSPDPRAQADIAALTRTGLLAKIRAINPEVSALSTRRFDDIDHAVATAVPLRVEAAIAAYANGNGR